MKKITFLMVFVALLVVPLVPYAETAQKWAEDCVTKCSPKGSGKAYADCLQDCLKGCYDKPTGIPEVPPPTPVNPSPSKSDTEVQKTFTFWSSENYQEKELCGSRQTSPIRTGEELC